MSELILTGARPLHCLLNEQDSHLLSVYGPCLTVVIDGVKWGLPERFVRRARTRSPDQLQIGVNNLLSNHGHDQALFVPLGWDGDWAAALRANCDLVISAYQELQRGLHLGSVDRLVQKSSKGETRDLLREFTRLCEAAGLRTSISSAVAAPTSERALIWGAFEAITKAQSPVIKGRLLTMGVTQAMLDRVSALLGDLFKDRQQLSDARAGRRMPTLLDALKGVVYGEMETFYGVARAKALKERAALYRPATLMGLPRRKSHGKTKQPQPAPSSGTQSGTPAHTGTTTGAQAGTPPPQHKRKRHHAVAGAAHPVHPHETAGHHRGHPAVPGTVLAPGLPSPGVFVPGGTPPGPIGGSTGPMPAAGTPTPTSQPGPQGPPAPGAAIAATGTTGSAGTAAPTTAASAGTTPTTTGTAPASPPVIPPIYFTGLDHLAPGTVLMTIPAAGGPALQAVVQPDHSVKWFPVPGEVPPNPGTVEQPAAAGPKPRTRKHKGRPRHKIPSR